jgi:hypothetical protein
MHVRFRMKLFKYRSFSKLDYVIDILLNERLHCSIYDKLNDPFEGIFLSVVRVPLAFPTNSFPGGTYPYGFPIRNKITPKSISELSIKKQTRICSLSSSLEDIRLWSYYADGHRGIAIEIDFTGIEDQVYEVEYVKQFKKFGSTLLSEPLPFEVLKQKTNHWRYEKEYRLIINMEYFDVKNRISALFCGPRISDLHQEILLKVVDKKIPIFSTILDEKKLIIEPNNQIN